MEHTACIIMETRTGELYVLAKKEIAALCAKFHPNWLIFLNKIYLHKIVSKNREM
jgi:hypothetical protein